MEEILKRWDWFASMYTYYIVTYQKYLKNQNKRDCKYRTKILG